MPAALTWLLVREWLLARAWPSAWALAVGRRWDVALQWARAAR